MLSDLARDGSAIKYHQINGEILIKHSLVTLNLIQVFENTKQNSIEVEYSVPCPKNAVLISLKAVFANGTTIDCKVIEKDSAQEKYQDKISKGHNPILATHNIKGLDIFIGSLPAKEIIEIRLVYTYPLTNKEDYWRFELIQGFLSNSEIKHSFLLNVSVDSKIIEWKSNWDFQFEHNDNSIRGVYDSQVKGYSKENMEFTYKSLDCIGPKCTVQKFEDKFAVMMAFIPYCEQGMDIDDYEGVGEFVFILDRSGSMGGQRIELAKQAASLFIKSLSPKSRFNIVSFGTAYQYLFPESYIANSENVNKAISSINSFSADMGGTEIYEALEYVFNQKAHPGLPKYAFLLTDGDVSSPDKVLDLILRNNQNCKVYSFGIEDANPNLIQGAAINGNGESYIIHSANDIGKNVIDALGKCVIPFISDARINWDCEFVPPLESLNNVQFGKIFCVYTVVSQLPETSPVFSCFDSFKDQELNFTINSFKFVDGDEIFKLWAKQKIETNCENTLELSIKHQVISPLTAYFGYKKNQEGLVLEINPLIIEVEVELQSDEDEDEDFYVRECEEEMDCDNFIIEDSERCAPTTNYRSLPFERKINSQVLNYGVLVKCNEESKNTELLFKPEMNLDTISKSSNKSFNSASTKEYLYIQIVLSQSTEGYWEWNELIKIINANQNIISLFTIHENSKVVATALALAFLNVHCESQKCEWILIEKKAIRWIKKQYSAYNSLVNQFKDSLIIQ